MRIVLIFAAAGIACSGAAAQEADRGAYVGFGVASFDYEEDVADSLAPLSFSDSAAAYKLYGGYRFSRYFALEASYQATDTVEESFSGDLPEVGVINARVGADFDVLAIRAIGHLPLSWGSLFVGAGYFDADWDAFVEIDDGIDFFRVDETVSEDGLTVIIGVQWDLSNVSLRAEYEWWDVDDADATQFGVAVHYRF
jgi:opacity protein-like surface antigen